MEFPKRLLVVRGSLGDVVAGEALGDLPDSLLCDEAEVAVYLLRRIKKVEVSRKLVKVNPAEAADDEGEGDPPAAPEPGGEG